MNFRAVSPRPWHLLELEELKLSSLFGDNTSMIGNRILAMRAWGRRIFASEPGVSWGGYSVRSYHPYGQYAVAVLVLSVLRKFTVSAVF
jgi:hypothetical protein